MPIRLDYRSPGSPRPTNPWRPVEMVLSLILVAFLWATFVPKFDDGHSHGQAKLSAAKIDLMTYRDAVNAFAAGNGRLPTTAEGLGVLTLPRSPTGPYAEQLRNDPWGHAYLYRVAPSAGVPFEVRSAGPDGRFGTADDIVWR